MQARLSPVSGERVVVSKSEDWIAQQSGQHDLHECGIPAVLFAQDTFVVLKLHTSVLPYLSSLGCLAEVVRLLFFENFAVRDWGRDFSYDGACASHLILVTVVEQSAGFFEISTASLSLSSISSFREVWDVSSHGLTYDPLLTLTGQVSGVVCGTGFNAVYVRVERVITSLCCFSSCGAPPRDVARLWLPGAALVAPYLWAPAVYALLKEAPRRCL